MDRVHLTTWVDRRLKEQFAISARAQGLSESALLRRLVAASVPMFHAADELVSPVTPLPEGWRISVRLRADDLQLLRVRALSRELPVSTYVSLLVRKSPSLSRAVADGGTGGAKAIARGGGSDRPKPKSDCEGGE